MIHLHLHSDYSVLDSLLRIKDIVRYAGVHGQKAIALTDHGTLGGLVEFYKECKKQGIKPILGCEFYHGFDKKNYHIIALARNKQGFDNLIKLNNISVERFYKKPRIFDEDIFKYSEGLIWLSACISGYLAKTYLEGEFDLKWYRKMRELDFYLEYQDAGMEEQRRIRDKFLSMKVPVVRTIDAHYMDVRDKKVHNILYAVKHMSGLDGFYALNVNFGDETSEEIADKIQEYEIIEKDWKMPDLVPDRESLYRWLVSSCPDEKKYLDRLDYEFNIIWDNEFFSYFSMLADLCHHFDEQERFRGWGRGSVSGSLVAYLMGITKIDPLKWNLYFERFLNPDRIVPPDIDLDFLPEDKDKAIEFMQKYGNYKKVGTYNTFGSKETINIVAKMLKRSTLLAKYVPNEAPVPTIKELMTTDTFINKVKEENAGDFIEVCMKIEGIKRNFSVHPSGIIDVTNIPLRKSKGVVTTDWNMYSLEDMKYVKIDILGVNTLSIIDITVKKIGIKIDDIPLDNEETFELIGKGWTIGIFQWESAGYANIIKRIRPETFDELVDLNTLYRPGCLESGITDEYIARKNGKEVIQWHSKLNLKRQGLPLFQEEIMEVVRELAGFTMTEADILRKAIGKKIKKDIRNMREKFVKGCAKHSQIGEGEAHELWNKIEKFARYTWNLSHAVAYTLISYWTAYLSTHYPAEFFCALLNQADAPKRTVLLNECRRRDITLKYPDWKYSGKGYTAMGKRIYIGMVGIKYIGEKTVDKIIDARPFASKDDFADKVRPNKRVLDILKRVGFFGDKPTLDDEREYLGYYVGKRKIDLIWWGKYANVGEILDVHKKVTKYGDPMAFLSVQFLEDVKSIVVFPDMWEKYKMESGDIGIFTVNEDNILLRFVNEVLQFKVSLTTSIKVGVMTLEPNVFYKHAPMGCLEMNGEALRELEKIGIEYIY